VAHYLHTAGAGLESVVAVQFERSLELVVALLGALKAGAAYLPLDPAYPEERRRYMMADAGAELLLTQEVVAEVLAQKDATLSFASLRPCANNLAYVIYTSGSTGRPKAAMNTHGAIRNRLLWMQREYSLGSDDCVLQKTPYSFDVSVWEFFWPLMYGAKLAVARPGGHQDPEYLKELIAAERVTTLHFVPSMLNVFLQHEGFERCRSVRRVIASGEALTAEGISRFFQHLSWAELHNLYGPTEAAVDVSYWDCSQASKSGGVVPIGRPIANTQLYILDARLEPAGIGIPGELYIGGVNVGRGYLRQPDLTAERFIPDPYGSGARLYRTGDRARFSVTGEIEFLGRVDFQVKLRGHRIELGEIEAALRRHDLVHDVVITLSEQSEGLVAYVVANAGKVPASSELRDFLQSSLPAYMIPAAFVFLERMPLNANGKIDRKALPEPTAASSTAKVHAEPATPLERLLAELWRESLKLDSVGIHDNFFEIGGDSLKGAILINQLQRRLGEVVYVVALFDAPTISELASYLNKKYPDAVVRLGLAESSAVESAEPISITPAKVNELRDSIARRPRATRAPATTKNPPAVFILSPPRSGSTLLRVMLAGNTALFAPPELELLSFATMSERRAVLSGRNAFSLEGAIRAVMELRNCDADAAKALIEELEEQQTSVQDFYFRLHAWSGGRMLVDKTPVYALEPDTLNCAEEYFEHPLYIHLLRHPAAMINSFAEARLDEVFFRHEHNCSTRELAELIWISSHQNIVNFLREIPSRRQHQIRFEELVKEPRAVMERLTRWLGVEFQEEMVQPYHESKKRMTDGIHDVSRMHGDMKFMTHSGIDASV
ncbi:MAG TPA: amino acid adenylation domain-containing protein, partial [Pyrinomonadaceae bacterium]|nr:amino acid adenylation domain-containing protein [Pyrinomonadaceae bacterium]